MFDFPDQLEAIQRFYLQVEPGLEDACRAMREMHDVQVWCEDKLQSLFDDALDVEDDASVAFVKDTFEFEQQARQDKTKQSTNRQDFEGLASKLYEEAVEASKQVKTH